MRSRLRLALWIVLVVWLAAGCAATGEQKPPDHAVAEAARNLGEAYLKEGRLTAALREFKKAEALEPDNPLLLYDMGLVYLYREHYDEAIDYFRKALELKPEYPAALNSMGNAYLGQKDYDRAIAYYKKALEDMLYATPQYPLSNMAIAYHRKGEYGLAERYFLEALRADPRFDRAMAGLAQTYLVTGRYPEAIERLQSALQISPDAASLHFLLAEAYLKAGDPRAAYQEYGRVVELAPGSPDAERAKSEMRRLQPLID